MAGLVLALAVLGPALRPGSVFALDAALVPRIPVPAGMWGLGPELPRRVPLGALLAWVSGVLGGALPGKALLGACLVLAFAGAARLAPAQWYAQLASGLLYAASPLVLTRVGAGQWTALVPFAVLPWALPTLLTPGTSPERTFLWASAMGLGGSVGGALALVVVILGAVAERSRAAARGAALAILGQLPWVVPGLVVPSSGARPGGAEVFPTQADGPIGLASLFAGHGFWRTPSQVGGPGDLGTALIGVGLLGLAVVGARALPRLWRWRAAGVAAVGLVLALASATPLVRQTYGALTRTRPGAPFRESQRMLVLTLAWMAPAAAHGAVALARQGSRLSRGATLAAPAAAAAALAIPGLWGVGDRLQAVHVPADWSEARRAVRAGPGTVLALPWHRYLDLPAAGNRRVLNPVPDYLGGDVVSSSDPELGPRYREEADPREPLVEDLVGRARAGQPVADDLAALGVRWVVVLHAVDWHDYRSLGAETGMRPVVRGPDLDLLEVRPWRGRVVDGGGRPVPTRAVVTPFRRLAASPAAVWAQPAAPGWMRGLEAAGRTPSGLVRLPAGRGPLWFWPAGLVVLADAAVVATAVVLGRRVHCAGRQPVNHTLRVEGTY